MMTKKEARDLLLYYGTDSDEVRAYLSDTDVALIAACRTTHELLDDFNIWQSGLSD